MPLDLSWRSIEYVRRFLLLSLYKLPKIWYHVGEDEKRERLTCGASDVDHAAPRKDVAHLPQGTMPTTDLVICSEFEVCSASISSAVFGIILRCDSRQTIRLFPNGEMIEAWVEAFAHKANLEKVAGGRWGSHGSPYREWRNTSLLEVAVSRRKGGEILIVSDSKEALGIASGRVPGCPSGTYQYRL